MQERNPLDASKASSKARGGIARANSLTQEERKEIARKAASARWEAGILRATHAGDFPIGEKVISAAVLENGKRVLTQETFLASIGRARKAKAGTGSYALVDGLPPFLQAEQLKPFISEELRESTTPVLFRNVKGGRAFGYDAQLLPMVCEVYLKLRDSFLLAGKPIPRQYEHIVGACDILVRGLARVGIVALVDEATGYQEVRDRKALQDILDRFIGKELAKWVPTFPEAFYQEVFRLRGWEFHPGSTKRPMMMAKITADLVYSRLAPGVLDELRRLSPKDPKGRRKNKLFQWLTSDLGHPALKDHISGIIYLAKAHDDWDLYYRAVERVAPQYGKTMLLPYPDELQETVTSGTTALLPPPSL